jgi:putative membrane protein
MLNIGGLVALYFTPLYDTTSASGILHLAVHAHIFLAGYLFAWIIAGADPAPGRPSVPRRLVIIGVAILGHAVVAQLLYANAYVRVSVTKAELRGAGDLMYYGGDIGELMLALALVTTWKPRPQRAPSAVGAQPASVRATAA